ncbi:MAG: MBL fold metallo-hydrolase [Hyphomicrobiaceae bacterium]|nr:MBL fold metallo-hydrolase [Hyphomicrobiaceae bacterium]MCC0011576.1 MBL fold metallo-hydrolase [Hyphomicrobiaceae bacterium]
MSKRHQTKPAGTGRSDRLPASRREVLLGGAAVASTALIGFGGGATLPRPALAKAPTAQTLKLGNFEITVVSDGHLMMPARLAAPDVPDAERNAALAQGGQSGGEMAKPPTNVTLIKTGDDVILIDAGSGPNFMPTAGKLSANLDAAGIDPDSITKVVFTHGHPDHLWGVLDDFEEEARFANATHLIGANEWDYWFSEDAEKGLPADRATFVPAARRRITAIEGKAQRIKAGDEIIPGLSVFDTPGHTQGHLSLQLTAGGDNLVVLGDALIHPIISFEHPDWRPAADHVPEQAVETRKKLLEKLVAEKSRVIGYHLPFPGIGRVEKKDGAYAYVAAG